MLEEDTRERRWSSVRLCAAGPGESPGGCPVRESDITDLELFSRSLSCSENDQRGLELESL